MNTFKLLILAVLATTSLMAQIPRTISYQGVLTDNNGKFIPDGNHSITVRLYEGLNATNPIYGETQNINVSNGLFNMLIGSSNPIPVSIKFDRAYFLGVSVDFSAELSPRTPFSAAAYALRAESANVAESLVPGAVGVVTSINSSQGNVNIVGSGGTSVNQNGSTITISSTNSGSTPSGPAGGDLSGTYPNPQIGMNKIKTGHIENGTISSEDFSTYIFKGDIQGPYPANGKCNVIGIDGIPIIGLPQQNQILKYSGGLWSPAKDIGFDLPYKTSLSATVALDITNTNGNALALNSSNAAALSVSSTNSNAIIASSTSTSFPAIHSTAKANQSSIVGIAFNGNNSAGIHGVGSTNGFAGFFDGKLNVVGDAKITGSMQAGQKNFLIDHPLDPENKTLTHTSIESPDMMNIYNGNVLLDENGEATIELPIYFEALNTDYKYQLTSIGSYSQVFIKEEIKENKFIISGGKEGQKISWQVTGVRKDPYALKFKLPVEAMKRDDQKGLYISPEAYGKDQSQSMYKTINPVLINNN